MKRTISLLLLLAASSAVSGYLMSKASWIGRVGMTFFYKEYNLLKIWWQGGLAVYIVLLILFAVHSIINSRLKINAARAAHLLMLLVAMAGLYFTYSDFSDNLAHRMLGWRFHYGFYLFWVDWMALCLFFITKSKPKPPFPIDPNSSQPATR